MSSNVGQFSDHSRATHRVGQKQVYSCEYAKHRDCSCIIIIIINVLFFIQTTVLCFPLGQ